MDDPLDRPLSNRERLLLRVAISVFGSFVLVCAFRVAIGDVPKPDPDKPYQWDLSEMKPLHPVTMDDCRFPVAGNSLAPGCAELLRQVERDGAAKNQDR